MIKLQKIRQEEFVYDQDRDFEKIEIYNYEL